MMLKAFIDHADGQPVKRGERKPQPQSRGRKRIATNSRAPASVCGRCRPPTWRRACRT